jgi:hypothetical protein
MDPCNFYVNFASRIKKEEVDFDIQSNGKIKTANGKKDASQKEKDNLVLSVALKMLNSDELSSEEHKGKSVAKNVIKRLNSEIGKTDTKKVLLMILKAMGKQADDKKELRAYSKITTEFREGLNARQRTGSLPKVLEKSIPKSGSPEVSNESNNQTVERKRARAQSQMLTMEFRLRLNTEPTSGALPKVFLSFPKSEDTESPEESSSGGSEKKSLVSSPMSQRFEDHLKLSEIYPQQEKLKKTVSSNIDSKKMKVFEKLVEEYAYLGPQAFETRVKKQMMETLNAPKTPLNIGADIFRYLSRNGILLSTSDVTDDALSKTLSGSEHDIISQQFAALMTFLIEILPDQAFGRCQLGIRGKKQKLCQLVKSLGTTCTNSTDLQNKIQEFIEKARFDEEFLELRFLSKILQSLAQDAPNKIGIFVGNVGTLHSINLERMPIDICLHLEKSDHKLYVIYKTYHKDRDLKKRAATGDPILFLLYSKVVFSLDLKKLDSAWVYEKQRIHIGLPINPTKIAVDLVKILFRTLVVLKLEPEQCVCPSTVPNKLSRI